MKTLLIGRLTLHFVINFQDRHRSLPLVRVTQRRLPILQVTIKGPSHGPKVLQVRGHCVPLIIPICPAKTIAGLLISRQSDQTSESFNR